jgi:hypothetical protein
MLRAPALGLQVSQGEERVAQQCNGVDLLLQNLWHAVLAVA